MPTLDRREGNVIGKVKSYFNRVDYILVITMTILICVGLYCEQQAFMSSKDKDAIFIKQLAGVFLGYILIMGITLIDYRILCSLSLPFYVIMQVILALTLVFASNKNNVKRWVTVLGVQLQPSELAKIVLILFLVYLCNHYRSKLDKIYVLIIMGIAVAIPMVLILLEPHLSSSLSLLFIFAIIVYASGIGYKVIGAALAIVVPVVVSVFIAVALFNVKLPFIENYQVNRVLDFLSNEESENQAGDYQQLQSIGAIGSGGLHGKVLDTEVDDNKDYNLIFAKESDFVFAIVGEDFGFIGSFSVIILFAVLIIRCLMIATRASDYMGKLICMGVSGFLMFQIFVNVGVATKFLPNTGLPLPFISYGLTSLISSMIAVGLVLNIAMKQKSRRVNLSFHD